MRGIYVNNTASSRMAVESRGEYISLLARRQGVEIMCQTLLPGATVWISPAEEPDMFEFFYVLSGTIRLMLPEAPTTIETGGCFYVDQLEHDVTIETEGHALLLYVTNKPIFDSLYGYQGNLNELTKQVDQKDHYTYHHSRSVMRYSVALARRLSRGQSEIDSLVTASLFHDIGKCFVPDEILNKPGRLTESEFQIIKKHPLDSARLLEPRFGKRVAEIARSHHERLDGSGYPLGLKKDEISLEGRIIAIADSFDTMTSRRIYMTNSKSFIEAARELESLPDKYDNEACKVLCQMIESGELTPKEGDKENDEDESANE